MLVYFDLFMLSLFYIKYLNNLNQVKLTYRAVGNTTRVHAQIQAGGHTLQLDASHIHRGALEDRCK